GYTSKEIGKILGLLDATVRSKEHRGLMKLRDAWRN
ncbi:MAG: RNA polymerase subunit sigma-70, partial [Lachnospiraceae bacterium]|nr:RNA polymerase subunit sigma-70 [Lachnospiraceae bacterium]